MRIFLVALVLMASSTASTALADELTAEQFISMMSNSGTFKAPLTVKVFKDIRALTPQAAQQVVDHFNAQRDVALVAKKASLQAELAQVDQQIASAQEDVIIP